MGGSAGQLLELVKGEARGCKDVACLTEASAVLFHLASLHADVSKQALRALLMLLCHRFPKVAITIFSCIACNNSLLDIKSIGRREICFCSSTVLCMPMPQRSGV